MPGEECQRALAGQIGAWLVITGALVTAKAVLRAGINMDLNLRPLRLDGFNIGQGNACILLAEMKERRHRRLVAREANNSAAIIANSCRQSRQLRCCRVCDAAAKAEADNANATEVLDGIDRSLGIAQHR